MRVAPAPAPRSLSRQVRDSALRSAIIRQFAGVLSEGRRAASGSGLPGGYRL